ncbi:fungal specific transcription factor domain-containing protein [Trichoderma breve]|uniref:Fungal specific transcription factor domain-containing protein n=1 Tax=Trichoderma breve TaxID=2034170 RepID=A0A9W9B7K5_9HYPO|nr:fungal specific transcription factor domain-containing protein [Trichoderma breve]KAJ4856119.1 fungal specific transcription factor domain-containing protein [Trichoderma breve]
MDRMGMFQMPGLVQPPLTGQPPQIFGYDGLTNLQQLPPDMTAQMFADSNLLLDDSQDAKRRRIARACDQCRRKKIKCDGKLPSCTHCTNYKTECIFTQIEKKRATPKGAKYIEALENRLTRMEKLLRLAGILVNEDDDLAELEKRLIEKSGHPAAVAPSSGPSSPSRLTSESDATASPRSSVTSPGSLQGEEEVEALSEMMCSLVTNHCGETRYIGSSSGFSIFSPKGVQWINNKTGDATFQNMISEVSEDDHKWTNWKPEIFSDLFQRPVFRPLPSKPEAMSLLKDFFENFNFERQYSDDPYQGSGWWASLNCALAIAHRLRVMSNLVPQEEDEKAWGYLKNAMSVFAELTMRNTDLLSVQALLGMALFMQGTPNPQPTFLLIAAAIRLSHSIGLHKKGTGFNLNPIEIEQRKRVFWIAYMLDKDLCLRSGRPPAQDDDDMNVELPDADPEDNIGNIPLADGKGKMNLFRVMCEFAVIESNVYKRLYSAKAAKQSDGELLATIGELDQELEEWKDRIPIDFRPEHEIRASHTPLILHIVMVHFTYYNCLTTIHRMSIHHGFWTSRLANYAISGQNVRPLNPRVFSSAMLSTAAARASIALLKYIPQGDFSCVWLILYFPVSALVTLFGNILQNPLDQRAKSDVRLMNLVVTFLSMLGQEAEQGGVHRMLGICSEFCRIAQRVIEKAEREQSSRRKRKPAETPANAKSTTPASSTHSPQHTGSTATTTPQSHAHDTLSPEFAAARSYQSAANKATPSGSSPSLDPMGWAQDFQVPQEMEFESFEEMTGFGGDLQSPPAPNGRGFQQPLLPQDLFSLSMSLDWNWVEMSGGAYPTVENGNFGGLENTGVLDPRQHQQ